MLRGPPHGLVNFTRFCLASTATYAHMKMTAKEAGEVELSQRAHHVPVDPVKHWGEVVHLVLEFLYCAAEQLITSIIQHPWDMAVELVAIGWLLFETYHLGHTAWHWLKKRWDRFKRRRRRDDDDPNNGPTPALKNDKAEYDRAEPADGVGQANNDDDDEDDWDGDGCGRNLKIARSV